MSGIIISDGGTIGSVSDPNAISIASDGHIDFKANNPTVTLGSNTTLSSTVSLTNATFPSGMIINAESFVHSSRTTVANSTSTDRELIDFGDYNKQEASSTLFFNILIPCDEMDNGGASSIGVKYGSAGTIWGGLYSYSGQSWAGLIVVTARLTGHTTTGAQAVSFRHGSADGTNTRPTEVMNPSATDDGRYHQHVSTAIVYEVKG